MAPGSSKNSETTPPPFSIIHSVSNFVTIKLTIDNYLLWKAQIVPFFKGNDLFGHLDGSTPIPSPTTNDVPNPAYLRWLRQDQLIMSALNASLSEQVLSQVLECTTAKAVWSTLHSLFAAQSCAHVMHTKYQLATLKKGSDSISTYLSMNPVMHARTKHVELDYHFIREKVAAKTLIVSFISSKDQIADILTKPLSTARFNLLRSSLTISKVLLDSRGANRKSKAEHEESCSRSSNSAQQKGTGMMASSGPRL